MRDYSIKVPNNEYEDVDLNLLKNNFYKIYVIDECFNRLKNNSSDGQLQYILDVETCYYTPFQHKKNVKNIKPEELFDTIEKEYKSVLNSTKIRRDYKMYLAYEKEELRRIERNYYRYLETHQGEEEKVSEGLERVYSLIRKNR